MEDARTGDADATYLFLYAEIDADLEGFLYKSDLYGESEPEFTVSDYDWNKHYGAIATSTTVGVSLEGKYDRSSGTLSDVHVVATQIALGSP